MPVWTYSLEDFGKAVCFLSLEFTLKSKGKCVTLVELQQIVPYKGKKRTTVLFCDSQATHSSIVKQFQWQT